MQKGEDGLRLGQLHPARLRHPFHIRGSGGLRLPSPFEFAARTIRREKRQPIRIVTYFSTVWLCVFFVKPENTASWHVGFR
jgi:hypothetical protein